MSINQYTNENLLQNFLYMRKIQKKRKHEIFLYTRGLTRIGLLFLRFATKHNRIENQSPPCQNWKSENGLIFVTRFASYPEDPERST